jgi:ABC-type multidrug transport system fused ATPase/permease subunit
VQFSATDICKLRFDMDIDLLSKTFTRYIVPGIVFVFLAIVLPVSVVARDVFLGKEPLISSAQVVVLSILTGYVLDSIRGYRWTLSWQQYNQERAALTERLNEILGHSRSNPDDQLAILWCRNEAIYNRIFVERAEWVMVLETAFSLLLSAVILIFVGGYLEFYTLTPGWPAWIGTIILVSTSRLASQNGIDRMRAHNLKLLEAIKTMQDVPLLAKA